MDVKEITKKVVELIREECVEDDDGVVYVRLDSVVDMLCDMIGKGGA